MALSNISSKHANNLLAELNTQELAITNNIKVIKSQHSTVAKLEILYRQMEFLKSEIQRVLDESTMTSLLNNATMKCVKCPNTTYHLYKKNQNQEYYLSKLHPTELKDLLKDEFIGSFLLKDDYTWSPVI